MGDWRGGDSGAGGLGGARTSNVGDAGRIECVGGSSSGKRGIAVRGDGGRKLSVGGGLIGDVGVKLFGILIVRGISG